MACRTRDDVLNLLATQEFQIFDQCQRGAFNTSCSQVEREALKSVKKAIGTAQSVIFMASQLEDVGKGMPTKEIPEAYDEDR